MALTDEQEATLRAELASLSGELATIARVNGLIQLAHARHEAEERQKDDELVALRARLAESEGRERERSQQLYESRVRERTLRAYIEQEQERHLTYNVSHRCRSRLGPRCSECDKYTIVLAAAQLAMTGILDQEEVDDGPGTPGRTPGSTGPLP